VTGEGSSLEDSGESVSVVPEEVRLFVCDRVQSVEGLEVLRRSASPPWRSWSASELALELYLSEDSVEDALETLVETGLFGKEQDGRFSYRPVNDRFDEIVSLALEVYHEHPSAMVQCLTTRAMSRVRVSLIRLTERLLDRARF
jgi:hypothetical protein